MTDDFMGWLKKLFGRRSWRSEPFRCERVEEVPKAPKDKTVYIVGDDECAWAAALRCPCGCRDVIHLSLVADASPSWKLTEDADKSVTLLPSVWRTVGCQSHFVLYRGRVFWCSN